jgi:hypothetical protein
MDSKLKCKNCLKQGTFDEIQPSNCIVCLGTVCGDCKIGIEPSEYLCPDCAVTYLDNTFDEMVRKEMVNDEFWAWVSEWKEVESIIDETENWDAESKLDDIESFLNRKDNQKGMNSFDTEWQKKARQLLSIRHIFKK